MSGNIKPDGSHTDPAGRFATPPPPTCNQALLALDADILSGLTEAQHKAVKIAQLQYSRDIATRAATAYQAILDIIDI